MSVVPPPCETEVEGLYEIENQGQSGQYGRPYLKTARSTALEKETGWGEAKERGTKRERGNVERVEGRKEERGRGEKKREGYLPYETVVSFDE